MLYLGLSRNILINIQTKFPDQKALQLFDWRIPLWPSASILLNTLLGRPLIRFELLHLWTIHMLHNLIRLPLLKTKSQPFVGIVFIIGLIFVIFYANEVGVCGGRLEREGDEGVYCGGFGNDFECPRLKELV